MKEDKKSYSENKYRRGKML